VKKYLPVILIGVGIVVLIGAVFLIRRNLAAPSEATPAEQSALLDVTLADRPVASLTPSTDGHWLELSVTKLEIAADSLDYELLYDLPDGRTQGVPGTIKLAGITSVDRDLLLGSESSGKYRYDEGVTKGTLTLRFRDSQGKLLAKFATDFHLQTNTLTLTSADGNFSYKLDKTSGKEYLVTMQTFGYPGEAPENMASGPYGVFKAVAKVHTARGTLPQTSKVFSGTVSLSGSSIYESSGVAWTKLSGGKASDVGIFIGAN
jgi:hypothetical protein